MFENALHLVVWMIAAIFLAGILGLTGIVVVDLDEEARPRRRAHQLAGALRRLRGDRVTDVALGSGIDELNPARGAFLLKPIDRPRVERVAVPSHRPPSKLLPCPPGS
jgi:hypothetical protein